MKKIIASEFIGMNKYDAIALAERAVLTWRILKEDGRANMHVNNANAERVNFVIVQDTVVEATYG